MARTVTSDSSSRRRKSALSRCWMKPVPRVTRAFSTPLRSCSIARVPLAIASVRHRSSQQPAAPPSPCASKRERCVRRHSSRKSAKRSPSKIASTSNST